MGLFLQHRANLEILIAELEVTSASVHDSQVLFDLVDESCKGESLFADSAYAGEGFAKKLEGLEVENYIHEKGYKNRPLSDIQKEMNKVKSSIRCRVEQIFL